MPDVLLKVLHAAGCNDVNIPDDITIRDLIRELVAVFSLPGVAAHNGQPLEYRLDSKGLGRRLLESETIADAKCPLEDTLILTVAVLAGSPQKKSRISIAESSGLSLHGLEKVEIGKLLTNEPALTLALLHYRDTLSQLADVHTELEKTTEEAQQLKDSLREKNIATLLLVVGQIQTGFGINLITDHSTGGWLVFLSGLIWTMAALCLAIFGRKKNR